eukprot:15074385-Alexandrium_andersonii.AAC.1
MGATATPDPQTGASGASRPTGGSTAPWTPQKAPPVRRVHQSRGPGGSSQPPPVRPLVREAPIG